MYCCFSESNVRILWIGLPCDMKKWQQNYSCWTISVRFLCWQKVWVGYTRKSNANDLQHILLCLLARLKMYRDLAVLVDAWQFAGSITETFEFIVSRKKWYRSFVFFPRKSIMPTSSLRLPRFFTITQLFVALFGKVDTMNWPENQCLNSCNETSNRSFCRMWLRIEFSGLLMLPKK